MTSSSSAANRHQADHTALVEVLGAFAFAADLGAGQPVGHALRTVGLGMTLADRLSLSDADRLRAFHTSFLAHAGCTAGTGDFAAITANEMAAYGDLFALDPTDSADIVAWLTRHRSRDVSDSDIRRTLGEMGPTMREHTRGVCEVGQRLAELIGLPDETAVAVKYTFEFWDGSGPYGIGQEAIPIASRLALAALTADSVHHLHGWSEVLVAMQRRSGTMLDPMIAEAVRSLPEPPLSDNGDASWESSERLWQSVLALEPASSSPDVQDLERVVEAFANFADIKNASNYGHARDTARLACGIARRFGMHEGEVRTLRWAALLHDLGNVTVPVALLQRLRPPTAYESEQIRLHPYYTERVLSRISGLREAARLAGMHHECLDGSGSYRGLSSKAITLTARILAVADRYDELVKELRSENAETAEEAVAKLEAEAGDRFDLDCVRALRAEIRGTRSRRPLRRSRPKGLTDREVEVLRLIAKGLTNREMAAELTLSERTIGRHIENIYNRLGVSSRAATTLFALEHELL